MMRHKFRTAFLGLSAALSVIAFGQNAALAAPQQAASVSSSAPLQQAQKHNTSTTKIVFLGDSLTAGYGLRREYAWPEQVQKRLITGGYNTDIINAGISGDNTAKGLRRYGRSVRSENADVLVLALGANDFLQGVPPRAMRANLAAIIERAQNDNLDVILAGVSSPQLARLGPIGRAYGAVYPDLARAYNLPLFPSIIDGFIGKPSLMLRDGIHPNKAGVMIMADDFARYLSRELDKR